MGDCKQIACQEKFKTMIGGQAVIEGVMMQGPDKRAVVIRNQQGELVEKTEPLKKKTGMLTWPLIRGVVNFGSSMAGGVRTLMYSAEFFPEEEEEPSKFEKWLQDKIPSEKMDKVIIALAVVLGLALSIGLFFVLPILIGDGLEALLHLSVVGKNLIEGVVRVVIFLIYMGLVSQMKDMKRIFSYHGAEHKTIRCYEARLPLTVENARTMTRLHPRCGTSFLFVVMIISIVLFTVANTLLLKIDAIAALRENTRVLYNLLMMIFKIVIMLPIVVSVSYECNRFVGRHDNAFTRAVSAPGMWLQNFTTNEPDDSMLEVAIRSLELVLPEEEGADKW